MLVPCTCLWSVTSISQTLNTRDINNNAQMTTTNAVFWLVDVCFGEYFETTFLPVVLKKRQNIFGKPAINYRSYRREATCLLQSDYKWHFYLKLKGRCLKNDVSILFTFSFIRWQPACISLQQATKFLKIKWKYFEPDFSNSLRDFLQSTTYTSISYCQIVFVVVVLL